MGSTEQQIELALAKQERTSAAQQFMAALQVGIEVLNTRLLTLLALLGGVALFAVAVVVPDWVRVAAAASYAVLVLVPTLVWAKGR